MNMSHNDRLHKQKLQPADEDGLCNKTLTLDI